MIYHADCIDILRTLPDGAVDMILQDPPYNMTNCKWECELDLPTLWTEWERVIKDNGAIVMTASQPFTSELILSNKRLFKYEWIWEKDNSTNFFLSGKQPMKRHENICVFYKTQPIFNLQKWQSKPMNTVYIAGGVKNNSVYSPRKGIQVTEQNRTDRHPISIVRFNSVIGNSQEKQEGRHPTQKPVDLFRYLIRTYTNEGETVFDGYGGSGTTAVTCIKENRKYIVCEKEAECIEVIHKRIDEATRQLCLYS